MQNYVVDSFLPSTPAAPNRDFPAWSRFITSNTHSIILQKGNHLLTSITESTQTADSNTENDHPAKRSSESIYLFFRNHTTFLVACISAAVAVISFVINYAISRYNLAYLDSWGIDPIYAVSKNDNQIYIVLFSFFYLLAMMVIHALLSGTSDSFRHYNKLLSTLNYQQKRTKNIVRKHRKCKKELIKALKLISPQEDTLLKARKIQKELDEIESELQAIAENRQASQKAKRNYRTWLYLNIGIAIVASFLIGMLFILLVQSTITAKEILLSTILVSGIILFDLLIYFLPAYYSTKCTKKRYERKDYLKFADDMLDSKKHTFPIEEIAKNGLRSMVSNKKIKLALGQFFAAMVMFIFLMTYAGMHAAETKTSFPIYSDGSGVYAVVYNNGQSLILEAATIEHDRITIDTSKQRIISSDNIVYEVLVFDEVEIINNTSNK